ncbi:hypothetical protein T02_44 [Trichinella nativa]|uniref:Uncharacterized protein n=1 Tax=Trichinella nativa TaxID=6335 RepID=A0A0V1L215_9BILA|nr:hypothetical protein T02_44 [Trichinella nativa]
MQPSAGDSANETALVFRVFNQGNSANKNLKLVDAQYLKNNAIRQRGIKLIMKRISDVILFRRGITLDCLNFEMVNIIRLTAEDETISPCTELFRNRSDINL